MEIMPTILGSIMFFVISITIGVAIIQSGEKKKDEDEDKRYRN